MLLFAVLSGSYLQLKGGKKPECRKTKFGAGNSGVLMGDN